MRSVKPNNSEKGASVVEFALILPLLLVMLFGIIEFGLILYDQAMLTNASREGARAGIVSSSPRLSEAEIRTIAHNYLDGHLITFGSSPAQANVTALIPADTSFGEDLTVRVSYVYNFLLIPGFIPGIPSSITLAAESVMKYE